MESGIYAITNVLDQKVYVGSAVSLRRRWAVHRRNLRAGIHPNRHLQAAFSKYGEDAFRYTVLENCGPDVLIVREQYWLDEIKPWGRGGYNVRTHAESNLGMVFTEEHRAKLRAAKAGKKPVGNRTPLTPEQREHLRKINLGKTYSEESRLKRSINGRGQKRSAAFGEAIRQRMIGQRKTEESARSAGLAHRKAIALRDPAGIVHTALGIWEFCKEHGLDTKCVARLFSGKQRQHKGWTLPEVEV